MPSCAHFDLEQFPRHFSFKNPTNSTQTRSLLSSLVHGDVSSQELRGQNSLLAWARLCPQSILGGWKDKKMMPLSSCTEPFLILYFGALLSLQFSNPVHFYLVNLITELLFKNKTHLSANAAQISQQFRRKGLRSFRHPLSLWESEFKFLSKDISKLIFLSLLSLYAIHILSFIGVFPTRISSSILCKHTFSDSETRADITDFWKL